MWTADANRCPSCPEKESCADRKRIIPALSALVNELNSDPAYAASPGDGLIIMACQARTVTGS